MNEKWATKLPFFAVLLLAAALAGFVSLSSLGRDQMISYLTGLRHLSGQRLYVDFFVPHGPLAGLLFTVFLWLTPKGGFALVFASAFLNCYATWIIWQILEEVTKSRRAAFIGSLLTALWFLPVFGTFYHDHLAYALVLTAFRVALFPEAAFLSGCLMALAFHAKQTVGFGGFLAFVVSSLLFHRKQIKRFVVGNLFAHVAIFLVICVLSSARSYFLYTFLYPFKYAFAPHSDKGLWRMFSIFVVPYFIDPVEMIRHRGLGQLAFYPIVATVYWSYFVVAKKWRQNPRSEMAFTLCFLVLSTLWSYALLGRLYAHCLFGMGGAFALLAYNKPELLRRYGTILLAGCAVIYIHHLHGKVPTDSSFASTDLFPVKVEKSPGSIASSEIINFLKDKPGRFVTLGDEAALVTLATRQAPHEPSVIFTNLTIPSDPKLRLDWEIGFIDAASPNDVRYIVAEPKFLTDLPEIKQMLDARFQLVLTKPPLVLYSRR